MVQLLQMGEAKNLYHWVCRLSEISPFVQIGSLPAVVVCIDRHTCRRWVECTSISVQGPSVKYGSAELVTCETKSPG